MLTYKDIKNIELEKNVYFNKGDIDFFNTDVNSIKALKNKDNLFIIDNIRFDINYPIEFKIKFYNYNLKQIQTLYSTENYNEALQIVEKLNTCKNIDVNNFLYGELDTINYILKVTFNNGYKKQVQLEF